MARIPINSCGHIDWPCCGCENELLTGEDALERMQEEDDAQDADEPWDGFQTDAEADGDVLASAGFGMDEDYRCDMQCEGYDEY